MRFPENSGELAEGPAEPTPHARISSELIRESDDRLNFSMRPLRRGRRKPANSQACSTSLIAEYSACERSMRIAGRAAAYAKSIKILSSATERDWQLATRAAKIQQPDVETQHHPRGYRPAALFDSIDFVGEDSP
jgi:hypothetical protein